MVRYTDPLTLLVTKKLKLPRLAEQLHQVHADGRVGDRERVRDGEPVCRIPPAWCSRAHWLKRCCCWEHTDPGQK